MIVKHIKDRKGWTNDDGLILGKEYFVIEITEYSNEVSIRIKDEQGTPALFPLELFEVIDNTIPPDWKIEFTEKNSFRLCPIVFETKNTFWGKYFEGNSETKAIAWQLVEDEIERIKKFHLTASN